MEIFNISDNKYILGIAMIIINMGSKYIIDELTDKQKEFIKNKYFRRIIIFCVFYIATKDILASITLTIIFILFISDLLFDDTNNNNNTDIYNSNNHNINL